MGRALAVDRVVKVTVNLQPFGASRRNFGAALIVGASEIISQAERIRAYTGISAIAADFGVNAPEYQAAELFFAQTPRPAILYIGRWIKTDAPAQLVGAILGADERTLAKWTGVTDGSLNVLVNGSIVEIEELDFSGAVTLEGIAAIISAAGSAQGIACAFDGQRFILSTIATGAGEIMSFGSGELAEQMRLTEETALAPILGADAETAKECAATLADKSGNWYGLAFADKSLSIDDHLGVAALIEAQAKSRIYAITTTDSRTLDGIHESDVASRAKALGFKRTMIAYSQNPYAAISALGRAFTVNFSQNRSTITLKFKQLPGIVAEGLSETQAQTLESKRCNVFAAYDNDTAIFQEGVMSGSAFFDEIHGLDWLQNAVQTKIWNLLYQSKTKLPQTDSGVNQIVAAITSVLDEAVNNSLVAPGIWNGDGFGQLEQGDRLNAGYYVYAGLVDNQDQSEREQRKAPPIRIAVKLAGAIHSVDVEIDVVR